MIPWSFTTALWQPAPSEQKNDLFLSFKGGNKLKWTKAKANKKKGGGERGAGEKKKSGK